MTEELFRQRKEMMLELIQDPTYVPMKLKELAMLLNVPREQRDELKEVMDALVAEGKVGLSKRGKYGKPEAFALVGTFTGNAKGFGFVTIEGQEQDIFIPADKTGDALHGDKVQIVASAARTGRRAEGAVIRVLERANETLVGYYQKSKNFGFVIPDNQKISADIFIPQGKDMGAVNGHKVVVRLTDYGGERRNPEGVITEIIGHVNDPGTDILSIAKAYGLPEEYPPEVMQQVSRIPDEITGADMAGRRDLRGWQTVTIDGEDAKDLDDAITLTKEDGIYHLGVHIADVSHYVQENTPLDKEALKRGTSVYLVDRVIPMLPHKLSNGICSLNAGADRLALSCFMDIDEKGTVVSHKIAESVVRVTRRMSYTSVKKIIEDKDPAECEEYKELVPMFLLMEELADILRKKRHQRGSIDFDFPESKIYLDDKGRPTDIRPYERNKATKIIEDFMLIANETVAEDYFWQELPFVYRTHDYPDSDKIEKLGIFINNFGYSIHISQDEIHPKELQKLMEKIDGTPEEALISRLTLRSMKQAKYTTDNDGHFGLATKYYCHFTSPIRRYPDLQIHRIIKENLRRGITEKRREHYAKILPEVATRSSMLERRADEAEREVEKLKKAEYMKQFIGEVFEGVISGLTTWGIYVELSNTVEGMIRVTNLPGDYFYYDEENYVMIGEHTRKTYKLGERILVEVDSVDKILKTIDFVPAEE